MDAKEIYEAKELCVNLGECAATYYLVLLIKEVEGEKKTLREYRNGHRDHANLCVNGRVYPGLGPMDDRCDTCQAADEMLKP